MVWWQSAVAMVCKQIKSLPMLKVIMIHFSPDLQSPLISPLSNVPRPFLSEFQGRACQVSPVSTCSRSIGKSHWTKNRFGEMYSLEIGAKNRGCK